MHKKTILLVLGFLCLAGKGFGQGITPLPLYIDGHLPNLHFSKVINYKDSSAWLSDFQTQEKKLVIFDFWNTHCSVCIQQFPKEDSLQFLYRDKVQFVLITYEKQQIVKAFIARWEKSHHQKLSIPIVVEDTTLSKKYIRVFYEPQFAWLDHNNQLIAQTSEFYLNGAVIKAALQSMDLLKADEQRARKWRDQQNKKREP